MTFIILSAFYFESFQTAKMIAKWQINYVVFLPTLYNFFHWTWNKQNYSSPISDICFDLDFHQCFTAKEWKAVVTSKSKKRKEPDTSITLLQVFISLYLLSVSCYRRYSFSIYLVRDCHNFSGIILDSLRCF